MRITILNGEPNAASSFQAYLETLTNRLVALGHAVTKLNLAALRPERLHRLLWLLGENAGRVREARRLGNDLPRGA